MKKQSDIKKNKNRQVTLQNLPNDVLNVIARKLNAPNIRTFRETVKGGRRPRQRHLASKLAGLKILPRPTPQTIRRLGYPLHKMPFPAHMLNGRYSEGNNTALAHALALKYFPNISHVAFRNTSYRNMLNRAARETGRRAENINMQIRRTAPRGMNYKYTNLPHLPEQQRFEQELYRENINRMINNERTLPGRVKTSLNKVAVSGSWPSRIKKYVRKTMGYR